MRTICGTGSSSSISAAWCGRGCGWRTWAGSWPGCGCRRRRGWATSRRCRPRRAVCSEATVNRKLSAISAFYEFHQRHGVDLGDLLTTWQRRKTHGGSWRPLLAHLGSRPERSRRIRLRPQRRIPDTLDGEQIAAIVAACDRLRDRFLFTLLAASGLRVGEALGLRHSDIDAAARLVTVVPRVNANRARAKGAGGRQVPVPARGDPALCRLSARRVRRAGQRLRVRQPVVGSDRVSVDLCQRLRSGLPVAGADRNHVRAAYFSPLICDRVVAPRGAGRGGAAPAWVTRRSPRPATRTRI